MHRVVLLSIVVGILILGCHHERENTAATPTADVSEVQVDSSESVTYDKFGIRIDSLSVSDHEVQRNESLYLILDKLDFDAQQIYSITQQARNFVDLDHLKPGQPYRTYLASNDSTEEVTKLVWQPNPIDYVVFDWKRDSLQIFKAARPLTSERATATGTIENSLYQTMNEQNTSPLLAYRMASIFAWQINFFGLREGDSYKVLYNKQYIDDEYYSIGDILAAEFEHRGQTFKAYQFSKGGVSGYFTEDGSSVQKALLKAPFKFSQRVSSGFSHNRMHPILNKRMPHYGIDYAAPYGTPVLSVGDGTVTEAQYRGANGNIVKITHNSTYRTAYLHLRGFAHGIRKGAEVSQGQIIGYVGSTGRSTGAHLDYRLYRNNRPVNPLSVELPSSDSVPDSLMADFRAVRDSLNARLEDGLEESSSPNDPTITQARAK